MNLSSIIIIVISSYFLALPLVVRVICDICKKRVPSFFTYGDFIKFIVIGATSFVSLTKVSGDVVLDIPVSVRVYCLLSVIGTIIYYVLDTIKVNKKPKVFEDTDKCNLAYVIYESFGDKFSYNFLCDDVKLTREQWELFKSTFKGDLFESNIEPFTDYIYSREKDALNTKDAKLLYKVCKAQLRYLNDDKKYTDLYSSLLNNECVDFEEHKLLQDLMLNNKNLFRRLLP